MSHDCIYKHVFVALPGDRRQIAFGPEGARNMFSLCIYDGIVNISPVNGVHELALV